MIIGVPSEVEVDEYRVAITPAGVRELVSAGHTVIIQSGAGEGSKLTDDAYESQGARLVDGVEELFSETQLLVKVKDPSPREVACSSRSTRSFPSCTWRRSRSWRSS